MAGYRDLLRDVSQGGEFTREEANELIRRLESNHIQTGPGLFFRDGPSGRTVWGGRGTTFRPNDDACPFGDTYFTSDGALMIRGGQVVGGAGNFVVDDAEIQSAPEPDDGGGLEGGGGLGGGGDSPPENTDLVWLYVSFTALVISGVLMPGGDVTAVEIRHGDTMDDDVAPTKDAPEGTRSILLGRFVDGTFRKEGCGNFQIGHCLGNLTYVRG